MAVENVMWGEERIANELKLKLGIRVSPRTVGKYLRIGGPVRAPDPKQRWLTFVRNHARVIVACDFFVVVTATFRSLYVFVIMDLGTRRILHHNVTAHPTAEWTLQQFREALPGEHAYRFVIHDRDSIFSKELDEQVTAMGVRVLKTPMRAPKANSFCERFGGTMRRECLDFLIPWNERYLRFVLKNGSRIFNQSRPYMSLGPGTPAHCVRPRQRALIATVFLRATRFDALPFSTDCTMSIGSRKSLRERRMYFLRNTGGSGWQAPYKISFSGSAEAVEERSVSPHVPLC
jgi:transposase InsO family protein